MAVKKRLMKSLMQKSRRKCFQQEVALAAGQAHGAEVAANSSSSRRSNSSQKKAMRQQTDIERLSEIGINDPDSDQIVTMMRKQYKKAT